MKEEAITIVEGKKYFMNLYEFSKKHYRIMQKHLEMYRTDCDGIVMDSDGWWVFGLGSKWQYLKGAA